MAARAFEARWPEIEERLRGRLSARGIPQFRCDDLVQETGLRLFKMWNKVDHDRPLWPLALTILLNLQRDEARRNPARELLGGVPDAPTRHDVEDEGLARIELGRVRDALDQLSPDHRSVLLMEVGHDEGVDRGAAALKMLRLRARRKLTSVLEGVAAGAGVVGIRIRRGSDAVVGFVGNRFGGTRSLEQVVPAGAAVLTALMLSAIPGVPASIGSGTTQDQIPSSDQQLNVSEAVASTRSSRTAASTRRHAIAATPPSVAAHADRGTTGSGSPGRESAHVPLPTEGYIDIEGGVTVLGTGINLHDGEVPFCVQGIQPDSRSITCERPGSGGETWAEIDVEVDTGTGRKIGAHVEAGLKSSS